MKEVIKTESTQVNYSVNNDCIVFGDNDLSLNLANREMDDTVLIDICRDSNGFLVVGAATGERYVAQIEIPARSYKETETTITTEEGEEKATAEESSVVAEPFNIDNCTIYLYGMEG